MTDALDTALFNLQRHCQATLTNALAHERITPLNKMLAFCQTILSQSSTVDQCRIQAEQIRANLERMRLMTESQISQYQFECKRLRLSPGPMRADRVQCYINDILSLFAKDIELSSLMVTFQIEIDPHEEITTDWSLLRCSLYHLLYNAVKHAKKGTLIDFLVELEGSFFLIKITN